MLEAPDSRQTIGRQRLIRPLFLELRYFGRPGYPAFDANLYLRLGNFGPIQAADRDVQSIRSPMDERQGRAAGRTETTVDIL
jgi:hypothetical protein